MIRPVRPIGPVIWAFGANAPMAVDKRPRLTPRSFGRSMTWLADRHQDPTPIHTGRWLPILHFVGGSSEKSSQTNRYRVRSVCGLFSFDRRIMTASGHFKKTLAGLATIM